MKILYLMPSANIFGGTPRKTLDLIAHSKNRTFIYFWSNKFMEYHDEYKKAGAQVYVGDFKKNIFKHLTLLLKIIDKNKIKLVQTQFPFGEFLAFSLKQIRPNVKVIVAFVGPFSPSKFKKIILNHIYKKIDFFVYVSEYVRNEKHKAFEILKTKKAIIIYNGTPKRNNDHNSSTILTKKAIFDTAGLVDWKNITTLIKAIYIILKRHKKKEVHLYIAGDGPMKKKLKNMISLHGLIENVHLLGYKKDIPSILEQCDIFAHPAYAEGFGIAVAEAMHAEKPIIVANAGALPELIENEISGLVVEPFNANAWADSIIKLLDDKAFSDTLARNAKIRAQSLFSMERFADEYDKLYNQLLNK